MSLDSVSTEASATSDATFPRRVTPDAGEETQAHAGDAAGPNESAQFQAPPMGSRIVESFTKTPGFLLEVPLSVSVEVGRVQMPVRRVMELGPGAIIELPRAA